MVSLSLVALLVLSTVLVSSSNAAGVATGTISVVKQGTTNVSIITAGSDSINSYVTVDLYITGASGVWAWSTDISWNPHVLQLADVNEGSFLKSNPNSNTFLGGDTATTWDNENGTTKGGITCTRWVTSATGNTEGVLASLVFLVTGSGSSELTLSNAYLIDVRMSTEVHADPRDFYSDAGTNDAVVVVQSSSSAVYNVAFEQVGLPLGTEWSVHCGGQSLSSTTSTVSFSLWSGSFSYSVEVPSGYSATPSSGTVEVSNAAKTVSIEVALTEGYAVVFNQSGLPLGTEWSVTCGGQTLSSNASSLPFIFEAGSYSYSVDVHAGYEVTPSSGTVKVTNTNQTIYLTFKAGAGATTLTFEQTGLPSGVAWYVTCNNKSLSSTTSKLAFVLEAGSYQYLVENVSGYVATPSSGNITVTDSDLTVSITFALSADAYNGSGLVVDVFTGRGGNGPRAVAGAYGPQELIQMYALVQLNDAPVASQDVSFSVQDAAGSTITLRIGRTNATGHACVDYRLPWPDTDNPESLFGTWSITALATVSQMPPANDTAPFTYNYLVKTAGVQLPGNVQRGSTLELTVPVQNIAGSSMRSAVSVTVYDEVKTPIGSFVAAKTELTNSTNVDVNIAIPSWAFIGEATVYVDILTDEPHAGGVPYCPETIVHFQIIP
ncbi:MAG: hypothetical protein NWF04_01090 [Candidatus Bathyarchaeota archaeon]|nr:hypothetical protein [Candidatus Bathyarchaeota archaeon]